MKRLVLIGLASLLAASMASPAAGADSNPEGSESPEFEFAQNALRR